MVPNEVNLLVSQEQHQDRLRRVERERLARRVKLRQSNSGQQRAVIGWLYVQFARLVSGLQSGQARLLSNTPDCSSPGFQCSAAGPCN